MEDYVVIVENVSKSLGGSQILKCVNLSLKKGYIYGIVGRNGSGKTVLFKCICGFMWADEGHIQIEGRVLKKNTDIPKSLGIIIESPGFLPNISGFKNLWILEKMCGGKNRNKVKAVMKQVGLDYESKKKTGKYSMGMRQRLGIAQSIMNDPSILILDEPMNGLDNQGVDDIRKLLLELKEQGKTILLASHNKEDIEVLCDEVYEMDAGRLEKKVITKYRDHSITDTR